MPAEDITLYAKWNIITYNINYELADGLNHLSNPSSYTIETNTIILSAPTKEGYTFEGWYSDSNFTNYVSEITIGSIGNLTLYAKWNINSYTLSFNSNGGSPVTAITQDYATTVSKPTDPTKVGYTFAGWYSDSNLSTAYTFTTMPAEDITLYAKWNINSYNINYYIQPDDYDPLKDILLLPGETIIQVSLGSSHSAALTSEGRLFTWGRNDNGQLGDGTTVSKSTPTEITQAHYELLHFDTVVYNQSITEYVPLRDGYTFSGWYSDINLNTPYIFGSMPAEDITLYGKWVSND